MLLTATPNVSVLRLGFKTLVRQLKPMSLTIAYKSDRLDSYRFLTLTMNFVIRPLMLEDELIVWKMLRYASHESSIESVKQQPYLARYAL
ncbi:MAG: hypothetical protein ACRCZS_23565, partial [Chroococcidiopsis sp.]